MYLGLVSDNVQVGYYTSAFKVYHLLISAFTALTGVMLPRMSAIVSQGDHDKFKSMINKSISFISLFSIPLIIGSCVMAPEIIHVLCGPGYNGAILPMQIIMPALLAVGVSHVLAMQILVPHKKDHVLLITSIAGAVVSIFLNVTVVPSLQSVGSALVLLSSEFTLAIIYIIYIRYRGFAKINYWTFFISLLKSIPYVLLCLLAKEITNNHLISLLIAVSSCLVVYILMNIKQYKDLFKN
jgi:O-antigen/teichoic acid export membrane protein